MPSQTVHYPFGAGLASKYDTRARPQQALDICRDVQFDELGGLQERYPYAAQLGNGAILGGGTLANCRRVVASGDELLVFTDAGLYSWSPELGVWVSRGTHLAVSTTEVPRFVSPGDQVDGDRAELAGTVVYAWTEGTQVYAAALSKTTGAVLVSPTAVSSAVSRPKLVALQTRILLFVDAGSNNLTVRAIDPAAPATGIAGAGTSVAAGTFNACYDVVQLDGADTAVGVYRRVTTTSYSVFLCTAALGLSIQTKARTADGPVAVSSSLGGASWVQVVRANGTNIQGDLLTNALADFTVGQALGTAASTSINQVAVAFSSSTLARVFWTSGAAGETAGVTDFVVNTNSVTTGNVIGTQTVLRRQLGIAARAFAYAGSTYVWLAFASDSGTSLRGNTSAVRAQLQNAYFLYRDDGLLVSRCAMGVGGGFAPSTGRLPGVALVSGSTSFAWCGTERRRIQLGAIADHTGFGSRSPREILFSFDSDAARRCVRIGDTLYVTGGIPLQYDGVQLAEVGFLIYPWYFEPGFGGAGNLSAGTYTWKSTMRWQNARGEVDRSTTASGMSLSSVPANSAALLSFTNLYVTLKVGLRPPCQDVWRTTLNPIESSPFYLCTSQDPNAGLVANGYIANADNVIAAAVFTDALADSVLQTRETSPENGTVLEYLAPPGATVIAATDTRIFLGAVAGDPDRVWYSRQRVAGEVASFFDGNVIAVPQPGGKITAFAFLNDTLVVFREHAIYAFGGDGFDNAGGGQNYGPSRVISIDVGATSQDAVTFAPMGVLFRSSKGWYVLGNGWDVDYVGGPVAAFDAETVLAMQLVETQHQVRILTAARMLFWDYLAKQWGEWTISDGVHACNWQGSHVYLTATGPRVQATSYTGKTYGYDVETAWLKPADLQGGVRHRWCAVLGELRGSHLMRIRVGRDYRYTAPGVVDYTEDVLWDPTAASNAVVGSALQVRHTPKIGQGEAIKIRLTGVTAQAVATLAALTGLSSPITTSAGSWRASWQANIASSSKYAGGAGNALALSIVIEDGAPFAISVRDHLAWSSAQQRWRETVNTVGVRIVCRTGSTPTVAQLEAAIVAGTKLITLAGADPAPSSTISAAAMAGTTHTGQLTGGAFGAPANEAAKLTGLACEVSIDPGLFRRLGVSQKA
jgi:hypothetical protein